MLGVGLPLWTFFLSHISNCNYSSPSIIPITYSSNAESGRRFGNQARRFWQHQEHDGLLGSGAFPRPPGYTGASAPKGRGNGHYQLSRSTEPYQPPRPYKVHLLIDILLHRTEYLNLNFPCCFWINCLRKLVFLLDVILGILLIFFPPILLSYIWNCIHDLLCFVCFL